MQYTWLISQPLQHCLAWKSFDQQRGWNLQYHELHCWCEKPQRGPAREKTIFRQYSVRRALNVSKIISHNSTYYITSTVYHSAWTSLLRQNTYSKWIFWIASEWIIIVLCHRFVSLWVGEEKHRIWNQNQRITIPMRQISWGNVDSNNACVGVVSCDWHLRMMSLNNNIAFLNITQNNSRISLHLYPVYVCVKIKMMLFFDRIAGFKGTDRTSLYLPLSLSPSL